MKLNGMKWFRFCVVALSSVSVLIGCTSAEDRRTASGNYDYLDVMPSRGLAIPEGLNAPATNEEYAIDDLESASAAYGRELDIRAPAQVLPLVEGSNVKNSTGSKISINFSLEESGGNVRDEVWRVLWEYFYEKGIRARFWDKQGGVLITDWFHSDIKLSEDNTIIDTLTFSEKVIHIRQRYLFSLDVNEREDKGTLTASLLGYEETLDNRKVADTLTDIDKRRYTVNLLNGAIGHYEFKKRVDAHQKDQQKLKPITLSVGQDASGLPAFIASAGFERTWSRLALVIADLGFTIEDRNKSIGTYYVRYHGSQSLWESIWGDGIDIDIPKEQYQILLGDLGNSTSITLLSIENRPVGEERLAEIYDALKDAMERGVINQ
ncbi:outer membrane protein assembly factor BamC [Corallincola spongiicola]|uniref:Outer membrane protein assembly factor BamC n=1 Tax=Corallincola spongiicola TaxID=2520508 RepID=A0ABY1WV93_9GAMM|nr:outer membrane protein assembly factor BamC [Corallincola spongiicola]TAA48649.1 outer membrane protein assembly factor BamC [Corallincola spongiicola]